MRGALFRDAGGRLRSGWRIALWLLLVALAQIPVILLLVWIPLGEGPDAVELRLPLAFALSAAGIVIASLVAWRALDGRPPGRTPLAPSGRALRASGVGFVLGLAAVAMVVVLLAAAGAYRIAPRACQVGEEAIFLGRWIAIFFVAAAVEELLFRGYPLFALRDGLGRFAAVLATAVLFALAHAPNPHFGWAAAIAIAWIGLVLGSWVLASRTLWGALGIHLGWNWALAAGAAVPVSGLTFSAPCYVGVVEGPEWLTGGSFGVEASALTVVVWALLGSALWARERKRRLPGADPAAGG